MPIPSGESQACLCLVRVEYRGSPAEIYQLNLAFASGEQAERMLAERSPAVVAPMQVAERIGVLYGATWEATFGSALLDAIAANHTLPGLTGSLEATHTSAFHEATGSLSRLPPPVRSSGEQSNTSLRFGDRLMLKLFRKVESGVNPDLEIGAFLTERTSFSHVPPALGSLLYRAGDGEPMTVGLLQGLVANQGDAWNYTLERLELFYERIRSRPPPRIDTGPGSGSPDFPLPQSPTADERRLIGEYFEMAGLLGRRTAELHRALASHSDDPSFAPERSTPADQQRFCQRFESLTGEVFALLGECLPDLAPPVRRQAEAVIARREQMLEQVRSAMRGTTPALRIRHHGDYHLGQVLWTGEDFAIIDFEGEPARSLAERRRKGDPLRDVAGMIRSFHYAAHHGLSAVLTAQRVPPAPRPDLERWAELWFHRVSTGFVAAYLDAADQAPFLPPSQSELQLLLSVYLLDKAVYELGYEINNRPDWVWLPLRGIAEVVEVMP